MNNPEFLKILSAYTSSLRLLVDALATDGFYRGTNHPLVKSFHACDDSLNAALARAEVEAETDAAEKQAMLEFQAAAQKRMAALEKFFPAAPAPAPAPAAPGGVA